ncbi:hypothetical protein PT974_05356 [Cladobotryum mycophilum]|uniref:DUF7962 domain-containing protein n=1 Tax=Cladobotryum mycophilum TaxID=491253 RepID=A0ABR0SII6_9HYPO
MSTLTRVLFLSDWSSSMGSILVSPEHRAIEQLLASYATDGGLFRNILQVALPHMPMTTDPVVVKDRIELIGPTDLFTPEALAAKLPQAILEVRRGFEILENIETVWGLHFLISIPGALPKQISADIFPKVPAWIQRESAAQKLFASDDSDAEGEVDEDDPVVQALGLKKGQTVQVWPTDNGSNHKELGRLVSINSREVVVETLTEDRVRIHAPRHDFAVAPQN